MTMRRPWSEVGVDVGGFDVEQALTEADLDFEVAVVEGFYKWKGKNHKSQGHKYIIRGDGPSVLGTCKGRFTPLQNTTLIEIAQPLIDNGTAVLDTIGTFGNGEKVWILLKLTEFHFEVVLNDAVEYYILLLNGHDGSTAIQMGIIPFRLVCANQLPRLGGDLVKFRHTENAGDMLQFFWDQISSRLKGIEHYQGELRVLAGTKCLCVEEYIRKVLKMKPIGHDLTTRSANIVKTIMLKVSGETYWHVFNAINEYLNYDAGRGQSSRLNSLWFGGNSMTNDLALKEGLLLCT